MAELSARYKGGLATGDHVAIGDRYLEVLGRNAENGKLVLADTSQLDPDAEKRAAYEDGVRATTTAWQTRPTSGCDEQSAAEPYDEEDEDELTDGQAIKDAAREEYEDNLRNAWRRNG